MGMPSFSYAANVSTNITICQILAPLPYGTPLADGPLSGAVVPNRQLSAPEIDLATYYILAGSSGAGTVVTLQELRLDTSVQGTPVWTPLTTGGSTSTPLAITLANSTSYGGVLNGPFHGLAMIISGVAGNGIAYARISATFRDK